LPRWASQVGGGFEEGVVEFLQRGEQRQDHEGQVRIDDAEVDRQARTHDLEGLVDQAEVQQNGIEQAVVTDDAFEGIDAEQERGPEGQDDDE
jgi:hypothetical protein